MSGKLFVSRSPTLRHSSDHTSSKLHKSCAALSCGVVWCGWTFLAEGGGRWGSSRAAGTCWLPGEVRWNTSVCNWRCFQFVLPSREDGMVSMLWTVHLAVRNASVADIAVLLFSSGKGIWARWTHTVSTDHKKSWGFASLSFAFFIFHFLLQFLGGFTALPNRLEFEYNTCSTAGSAPFVTALSLKLNSVMYAFPKVKSSYFKLMGKLMGLNGSRPNAAFLLSLWLFC